MSERLSIEAGETRLDRRPLSLRVRFDPFSVTLARAGATLLPELTFWAAVGESHDRFVQPTEGVIAVEQLGAPELVERVDGGVASAAELELDGTLTGCGRRFCLQLRLSAERVAIAFEVAGEALRLGARWAAAPGERFVGLGANHGHRLDQSGRGSASGPTAATPARTAHPTCSRWAGCPRGTARPCRGSSRARAMRSGSRRTDQAPSSTSARRSRSRPGPPRVPCDCTFSPAPRRPRGSAPCWASPARPRSCPNGPTGTGRAATSTPIRATWRMTSTATPATTCRSTRSSSIRRGRPSTTPGGSTRTSSPTPPG